MSKPLVDIIVLVHNRADVTADCLKALSSVDPGVPVRINVLDNGSGEQVQKLLSWWKVNTRRYVPWARYRRMKFRKFRSKVNMGFSQGNNYVARRCWSPWLLFFNNDAFPTGAGWLRHMIMTATHSGFTALGPTSNAVLGSQHQQFNKTWPPVHPAKFLSGFCFLIQREVFQRIGGWDERFFNGDEDLDLSIRLRLAGHRIGVDRDVFVLHANQATLSQVAKENGVTPEQWYARTRQQLVDKWTDYIVRDLWVWEDCRLPETQWANIGVMKNGFYHNHPGTPARSGNALDKLRARSREARNAAAGPDSLGELQARYTITGTGETYTLDINGNGGGSPRYPDCGTGDSGERPAEAEERATAEVTA